MTKYYHSPDILQSINSQNPKPWLAPELRRRIADKRGSEGYGIAQDIAQDIDALSGDDSGGGYVAKAVRYEPASDPIRISSLIAADSSQVSVAGWFRIPQSVFDDGGPNMRLWYFGNESIGRLYWNVPGDVTVDLGDGHGGGRLFAITPMQIFQPDAWTWVGLAFDMNFAPGSRVAIAYANDTSMGISPDPDGQDLGGPLVIPFDGVDNRIAEGTTIIEMADVFLWPGQVIDFSVTANRRKFIDGNGKPVDPTIAVAAFGTPADFHSGDAAVFITNQGSGGTATTIAVLTNATTSPSD